MGRHSITRCFLVSLAQTIVVSEPHDMLYTRNHFNVFVGLFLVALMSTLPVRAQQVAGQVERQKGTANRMAVGTMSNLEQGSQVLVGDEISTGPGARLQIVFDDESELTLSENARITIDEFVYAPDGESSQALKIMVGIFRFASGKIGKQSPQEVAFLTPVGTLGIRGTEFLGGELTVGMPEGQPHYGFQIAEGAIEVITPGGSVILDEAGEGTFLPLDRIAAPTAVRQWTDEETAEAVDALAF